MTGKKILSLIFVFCALALVAGCHSSHKSVPGSAPRLVTEDFDRFYDRFHTDMEFQLSRVHFPLGGYRADGIQEAKWSKDNWPYMKVRIYDVDTSLYQVSYHKTDREFVQKVWLEDSGFSSEARFILIKKRWYLVYVLDLNL